MIFVMSLKTKNLFFLLMTVDTNIFVKAKTEAETIDLANKILQNVSMYIVYGSKQTSY